MPEKLLTIRDVADYLRIPEEEVKRLVDAGEIPAYKIGDSFLRFRREQIEAIKTEISDIEEAHPEHAKPAVNAAGHPAHPYTEQERDIKRREPSSRQYDYTPWERVKDFIYFNDFYILCFIIIGTLMYLIFRP